MMINALITLLHALFAWTVMACVLSWLLSLAYPLFKQCTDRISALPASSLTLGYVLLGPAVAFIAVLSLSLPQFSFSFIPDHCHHGHCEPHQLYIATTTFAGSASVSLVLSSLLAGLGWMVYQLIDGQRRLRLLESLAEQQLATYQVINSPHPLAWCAGLWKPKVYISSGLMSALDHAQLDMVLMHEFTHAARRDNLRKWILRLATSVWPRALRRCAETSFSNYNEQVCDAVASRGHGSVDQLNSAIQTLSAISESDWPKDRISVLQRGLTLEHDRHQRNLSVSMIIVLSVVALALVIVSISIGHPMLELLSR